MSDPTIPTQESSEMQLEESVEVIQEGSKAEWQYNQLVWAKLVGYPYWPSIVCS